MCEPGSRCDKPSCPCNEPDTELKDALARMQERFPAPWKCDAFKTVRNGWLASASMEDDNVVVQVLGPTPHAAVDAAIKAYEDMVKADALYRVLKAECEASRGLADSTLNPPELWNMRLAALNAARAETDKAGALR